MMINPIDVGWILSIGICSLAVWVVALRFSRGQRRLPANEPGRLLGLRMATLLYSFVLLALVSLGTALFAESSDLSVWSFKLPRMVTWLAVAVAAVRVLDAMGVLNGRFRESP